MSAGWCDIYEVCPRDGFQNIMEFIPTDVKITIIKKLIDCGIRRIQITSFVSPRAVAQMADAAEVARRVIKDHDGVCFGALVPNLTGARQAWSAGIREISYVASVSEAHNRANVNRSHDQSFEELKRLREELPDARIIFGAATAFACPFEGETKLDAMLGFVERAAKLGVHTIELSDTIGMAYPAQVERFFAAIKKNFPETGLGAHFHDTRNNGILNSWLAVQFGVEYIQTALGGLGGCPFAPGASGNTSTEDLVWLMQKSGLCSGIDFEQLLAAARYLRAWVSGNYSGHHVMMTTAEEEHRNGKDAC